MTHSVPTRRSSDLPTPATCRAGSHSIEALSFISGSRCLRPLCLLLFDATSTHVPAAIGERERDPHHKYPHGAHGKPDYGPSVQDARLHALRSRGARSEERRVGKEG